MRPFEMVAGGGDRPFPGPRIGIPALFLLLLLLLLYLLHLRFPVLMEREKESGASLLPDKKKVKNRFRQRGDNSRKDRLWKRTNTGCGLAAVGAIFFPSEATRTNLVRSSISPRRHRHRS